MCFGRISEDLTTEASRGSSWTPGSIQAGDLSLEGPQEAKGRAHPEQQDGEQGPEGAQEVGSGSILLWASDLLYDLEPVMSPTPDP